ncbi:inositol monophosphatase 3 isoform X1 [Dunckerocampus dactyliophorus]|uniref:inositol monophosphatase 3 isoform X1 n=1 Tax=Dunckerocampus dactyliophorus TaxID=161453 RepID=UPI002405612C|nr:inositol monophosphatase 3 isoform X1 [Dunckerocampus dactyliophorus]XP_054624349.1 inositol monophosphatase 3 isoform X1 [Dunckerocampus dactyliophorus]
MAPMGIRLSPLGVAVFCLVGVGILYHLYAEVISSRLAAFRRKKNIDVRELLAASVEAAVLGGKEVKKVRAENSLKEKSKGKTKEGANELLTLGDLLSHRKMYNLLRNTFPEVTVISEEHDNLVDQAAVWSRVIPAEILDKIEGGKEVPAERVTVWIDPLDATQEYTENLVKYVTTMVCVAVDGKPVIGVIHQPFTGFTAWALVHQGSNMSVRSAYSVSPPKVIVSRSHSGKVRSYIHDAFGNSTAIIQAGGAGYKVLSLLQMPPGDKEAIDQADVYIHITFIKKWDICAGAALLTAMGGHMTSLKGEDIDYSGTPLTKGGLVASVSVDHKAILGRLPNWDPDQQ